MSFSLRTLLTAILLAAIFIAALLYPTPLWAMLIMMLALGLLVVGVVGVWLHRFNRTFWIPFCTVGWLYVTLAMTPASLIRLVQYLPSTHLSHQLRGADYDNALNILGFDSNSSGVTMSTWTSFPLSAMGVKSEALVTFGRFADIMHAMFALIFAGIAGLASILLKQRPTSPPA